MNDILEEVHKFCGCVCKLGVNCAEDECTLYRIEQLLLKKEMEENKDENKKVCLGR